MNKIVTLVTAGLLLLASVSALSQYDDYDDNQENDDGYGYDRPYDGEQEEGYETSFGNRYEYDLSDPSDRIMYEVDPAAQLRDKIYVNPARELERDLGEYGGGVLDDE